MRTVDVPSSLRVVIALWLFRSLAPAEPAHAQSRDDKPVKRDLVEMVRPTTELTNRENERIEKVVDAIKSAAVGPMSFNTDGGVDLSWRVSLSPLGPIAAASSDGSLRLGIGVTYPFASGDLSMLVLPLSRLGNIAASVSAGPALAQGYLQLEYSVEVRTSPTPLIAEGLYTTSRAMGAPDAQLRTVLWLMSGMTAGLYTRALHMP